MKARKIVLAVLLSVLMIASALLVVACHKVEDESVKIDLLKAGDWSNDRDETSYNISDSNGKMIVEYETSGAYQYVKRTLVEDVEQLAKIKTLVFKASVASETSEHPVITLKFEGGAEPLPEIKFEVGTTEKTYEWDVSQLAVSTRTRLLLFMEGELLSAKGTLTASEFYMTSDAINTANKIVPYVEPTPEPPKDITWNEIKDGALTVNAGWYDAGSGVYTATKNTDNSYKIVVAKQNIQDHQWPAAFAYVYGDAIKNMKSFRITVKGTAGTHLMVKPFNQNSLEKTFDLNGEEQTFIVDIADYVAGADRNFVQAADAASATDDNKVALIYAPGTVGKDGSGEFTIISAEFSTEYAPITENVKVITADDRTVGTDWYSLNRGEYVPTVQDGKVTVTYTKQDSYSAIRAYVKGESIANMKSIVFTVKGPEGKTALLKPFDANIKDVLPETPHTFDGNEQVVKIGISKYIESLEDKTFAAKTPIVIIMDPGDDKASGSFEIINVEFSTDEVTPPTPEEKDVVNEITVDNRTANAAWYDGGDNVYTIDKDGTAFNVKFQKAEQGNEWSSIKAYVKGAELAQMKSVVFTISGDKGLKLMLKPFDDGAIQQEHELNGTEQTFVLPLGAHFDGITPSEKETILIFAAPNENGKSGEFRIINVEFSTKEEGGAPDYPQGYKEITATDMTLTKWEDGGDKLYTFEDGENGAVDVTVTKNNSSQWAGMRSLIYGEALKNVKTFRIVLKGTAGEKVLVKPFDSHETTVEFTGEEQVVNIFVDDYVRDTARNFTEKVNIAKDNTVVITGLPGETQGTQKFTIVSATFVGEEATTITAEQTEVNTRFYSNDPGVYKFEDTDDGLKLSWNKESPYEWAFCYVNVTGEAIKNYTKVIFKVTVTEAIKCTFKPFDNNDIQKADQELAPGDTVTIEVDYSSIVNTLNVDQSLKILIFAQGGIAGEGSMIIESIYFA